MLRTALIALVLAAGCATAPAQADETATVTVQLTGLQPQGSVMMQVFNSAEGYGSGDQLTARQIPITAASASVSFENVPPGQYAIRLFHDVNGNGQLDTNPFGIPTEPFAFSNNARGRFGPASWEDAVFTVTAGPNVHQITIPGSN
ncbi:MAG: hypothetical protein DCF16_06595 [Alphaproteobacteria bacterium]|nr:MAG: hypothetical protein DCF16_06595 [Alphaproteobacteria bacterium]